MSLAAGGIIPGVSLTGTVELLVNASNQTQMLTGFVPTGMMNSDGTPIYALGMVSFAPGIKIQLNGDLKVGSLLDLNGEFDFTLQLTGPNAGLTIMASATLMIGPFGGLSAIGVLAINSQGLVTYLSITLGSGNTFGSSVGLSFNAMATLELNTTGTAQSYIVGGQSLTVQPGFMLAISGSISFGNLASATGSALISITNQQFVISFNITIQLGGALTINASGFAGIYNDADPGLALELNTSIDATVASIINIDASGTLLLNTTGTTRTANGFTLGPNSFDLAMNGSVSLLSVLSFNASFMIVVGGNPPVTFNPKLGPGDMITGGGTSETEILGPGDWYVSFNANISFFGLATLSAYGMFDYQGQFAVGLSGKLTLGTNDFGLVGQFSINACLLYPQGSNNPPYFDLNGSASVTARLFGISLASLGIGFDAQLKNAKGSVEIELSVTVHIQILFITISHTASFDIGVVQFPTPFYLAGGGGQDGANSAQVWNPAANNGTLYLNTGALAQYRDLGPNNGSDVFGDTYYNPDGSIPVESYIIDDEGPSPGGGETIKATAFGQSQTFMGVKRIVDDASDPNNVDNESLIVDQGVQVPVVFIGGPNSNTFVDNGNGYAVGYGGGSKDATDDANDLEVGQYISSALLVGGPAINEITDQSSTPTYLVGGSGNNQINGGTGTDMIYGHAYLAPVLGPQQEEDAYQPTGSAWTLDLSTVSATDYTYASSSNYGSDTIVGGGGNDTIDVGFGNNALDWPLGATTGTLTFAAGNDMGMGTQSLYIEASKSPNYISVTNPPNTSTILIADLSSSGATMGTVQASGFTYLELDGGASSNNYTIGDLGNTGIQNVTLNAGQDIVDTGATQAVSDPSDPGQMITEPVVNVEPHSGADLITIMGNNNYDTTFTLAEDNPNSSAEMTQVQVTDNDGPNTTINFTITNSIAAQGDTLAIDAGNGGSSTINASGMGTTTPSQMADYPQLINLVEQAGSGTDTLIATPSFNDTIELGSGSDTVYGGLGQETFLEAAGATGSDTLIESHNVDFGLYNNKLVMGTALEDGGGSMTFAQYEDNQYENYQTEAQWVSEIQLVQDSFPNNGVGNYFAGGSVFSGGSVIEPINNFFADVELMGGHGNNTMVVNSPTGTINVGGASYSVAPFAGSAKLDSTTNTAGGIEFYVINFVPNNASHISIVDTGGTMGDKVVMANGTNQGDDLTLNATGGGGFRVGTLTDSVVSNMSLSFAGSGIVRLVVDTLSGNDNVLVNDTAVPTFIAFGSGTDNIQVGTVPLIPDTSNRTLEYPNGVPVVNTNAMTNGNSNDLFAMGGSGNDTFEVNHNSAMLYLHGGSGINVFVLNTFLVLRNDASNPNAITNLDTLIGGTGSNRYSYLQNAPVDIIGGTGYNTIVVVGTPLADTFVVGNNFIAGAGIFLTFTNVQSIEIDGAGGNDTIYVMATNASFSITVGGGSGDNTIDIGGDPPPLIFNPPPFTYTPPPVMVPQPPMLVTSAESQTFNNVTLNVNSFVFAYLELINGGALMAVVQQLLRPFLAAFGTNIPDFQQTSDSIVGINQSTLYNFFNPFQFAPETQITVESLTVYYNTSVLVPQAPLDVQPPSVTVTEPPYAFQAAANFNAASITGPLVIDAGTGEQVNGNTVIFHDEDGTAGTGFLRLDTFPQLTAVGQLTPNGYTTPVPLYAQNNGLTQTYLTLGGFGMGISPTMGVNPYPNESGEPAQFVMNLTPPVYDGIEITDVTNLELLLPSGGNTVDVDSVPSNLNLTVDPGAGTNTLDLAAAGASTTIDAGAGNNSITVGQNGQLNQILSTLTVDGTAHLTEPSTAKTGLQVGESLLTNLPLAFTNTEPAGSFVPSDGSLGFAPATTTSAATITWSTGNWTHLGFQAGDPIDVSGTGTANDGTYVIASISLSGELLYLAAGSVLVSEPDATGATITNPQTPDGSFQGSNSDTLAFNPAATNPSGLATIVQTGGSWITEGFLAGDQISVTGTGPDENDGIYVVSSISTDGSVMTLASGSTLVYQPDATDASVVAYVADPAMAPIVEPIVSGQLSGALEVWTVVVNSSGSKIQDMVQEWGSQDYGIQETNNNQPLYYDDDGNPTTTNTGIPIIIDPSTTETAGARAVYYNSSNNEVFTVSSNPVYLVNFTSGSPLYRAADGYLTTTPTNTPFLIPVNRTEVVPWTALNITVVTEQGTNFITLDDLADSNNVIDTVTATEIPINQLKDGQPVYDGGAISPTAQYYFGGEPVIDPFTGKQLYYTGGEPVLNLLTRQPEYGPNGEPLLNKAGDPMLHIAGDPVVHSDGDTAVYLGRELVTQGLVADSALLTGGPSLTFTPAQGGNDASIERSEGNWGTDGFTVGSELLVSGTAGGADDGPTRSPRSTAPARSSRWCRSRAVSPPSQAPPGSAWSASKRAATSAIRPRSPAARAWPS